MTCEMCLGTIDKKPADVIRIGPITCQNSCAYRCNNCGALHSEHGKILLNGLNPRQYQRILENGRKIFVNFTTIKEDGTPDIPKYIIPA